MSIAKIGELKRKLDFYEMIRQMYKDASLGFEIAFLLENNEDILSDFHDFVYEDLIVYAKESKRRPIRGNGHGERSFVDILLKEIQTIKNEIDYENFKGGK